MKKFHDEFKLYELNESIRKTNLYANFEERRNMAGIKGKSGGKRAGSGAKKLPNELKRDNIIRFTINDSEKEYIESEFKILKKELRTKANADVLTYLLKLQKNNKLHQK